MPVIMAGFAGLQPVAAAALAEASTSEAGATAGAAGPQPPEVHLHAPAFSFSFRGSAPTCPDPEPCARPLGPFRSALRWLALHEGWLPEAVVAGVFLVIVAFVFARRCAAPVVTQHAGKTGLHGPADGGIG